MRVKKDDPMGHSYSNPEQVPTTPTIDDLRIDFKEFEEIHKGYSKQ